MKNRLLLFLTFFLNAGQLITAQSTDSTSKHWGIGAAFVEGTFRGAQIKADYFFRPKLTFSSSLNLGTQRYEGTAYWGYNAELMFTGSYYILGHNATGRGGLYVLGGLGYDGRKFGFGSTNDTYYFRGTVNGLASTFGIGADLKLKRGRLFFEIQNPFTVLGDFEHHGNYESIAPIVNGHQTIVMSNLGMQLKLGYTYHFK